MAKDLQKLIEFVGQEIAFTPENYPPLEGATEKERFRFALNHSALHFSKTAGKMAAVSENADHGDELDIEELKKQMVKSLINLLWLAEKTGMTEGEFISGIEKKYGKTIPE